MNLRRKKKGFTIVELVIVIAVIGVLAAILIPTFVGLVNRANITSDNSLVRDLNNAIAIDSSTNGKHKTMHDALAVTDEYGFNVSRINAKANKSEILWDSKNDVFCYFDGNEIKYIPETTLTTPVNEVNDYDYFVIRDVKTQGDVSTKYSTYLRSCELTEVTTTKGLDVGETTLTSITYNGGTTAQDVVIRTNSDSTNIVLNPYVDSTDSTLGDHIEFYGEVGSITGPKDSETGEWTGFVVATHSFKINGKVKYVQIADGRIVLGPEFIKANKESESKTSIHIEKQDDDTFGKNLIISYDSNLDLEKYITLSRDDVEIAETGTLVIALQNGTEEITESTSLDYIWLTKQGIYEQIKVSDSKVSAGEVWADDASNSEKTQEAAQQIANNIGRDAAGNVKANVTIDSTEYTVTLDENRNIVVKDSNDTVIEATDVIKEVTSSAIEPVADKESIQIGATLFAGGTGKENDPYLVSNRVEFENMSEIESYSYFKWVGDSNVDASNWSSSNYLCGSFDGNGVVFNNLDCFLFRAVWNGSESWNPAEDTNNTYTIKNFTVNVNIVSDGWIAAVVRVAGVHNFVMENVTVHGYVEGASGVASFVCFGAGNYAPEPWTYDGHITFKNCNSDAIIVAKSGNAVGFIAHAMTATSDATVTLENSNYTGTMSCSSCKYICGNWINATITDDQSSSKNNVIYKTSDNGWKYIEEGKTGSFTVKTGTLPSNIGDLFELDAESGATKAIISLVISPNPGCFTSTYMTEEVNVVDGKFTSENVKYFTIRINANGVTEEGVHGNYYDVVNSIYNGTLGANTTVRFTQYNAAGGIISITNYSFNDK